MSMPHTVQCGNGHPDAEEMRVHLRKYVRLALNVTTLTVSLVGLSKSIPGGGRELVCPDLYCRWAHVQPLARCLSGQATAAELKDLKPPLQAFCELEGILVASLAIQHTVLAPSTCGSEGLLVWSLWSFLALRKVMNGVRLTVGQIHSLGIAHSIVLIMETRSLKVPRWRKWATTIGEVNSVDVPAMVRAAKKTQSWGSWKPPMASQCKSTAGYRRGLENGD